MTISLSPPMSGRFGVHVSKREILFIVCTIKPDIGITINQSYMFLNPIHPGGQGGGQNSAPEV